MVMKIWMVYRNRTGAGKEKRLLISLRAPLRNQNMTQKRSSPHTASNHTTVIRVVGIVLALGFAITLVILNVEPEEIRRYNQAEWVPVEGRITSSGLKESGGGKVNNQYRPRVLEVALDVKYKVDGKVYQAQELVMPGTANSTQFGMEARLAANRYEVGQKITVYVHPYDPNRVTFDLDYKGYPMGRNIVPHLALLIIFGWGAVWCFKHWGPKGGAVAGSTE